MNALRLAWTSLFLAATLAAPAASAVASVVSDPCGTVGSHTLTFVDAYATVAADVSCAPTGSARLFQCDLAWRWVLVDDEWRLLLGCDDDLPDVTVGPAVAEVVCSVAPPIVVEVDGVGAVVAGCDPAVAGVLPPCALEWGYVLVDDEMRLLLGCAENFGAGVLPPCALQWSYVLGDDDQWRLVLGCA